MTNRPEQYRFHQGDRVLPFAAEEYDARLAGLRELMEMQGIDACVFTSMHSIAYYSGFLYCSFGRPYGLVVTSTQSVTISAGIDAGQPWRRCHGDNITYTDWARDNYWRAVLSVTGEGKVIGCEADHLTLVQSEKLNAFLKPSRGVDISKGAMEQRMMKSAAEIALIRHGAGVADVGGFAIREAVKAGLREIDIAMAGRDAMELRRMMPEVLAGVLPRLYPQMLQIAYDHQDAGRKVYIATASSQIVAEMLSDVLGFDGGIGAVPEIVDGKMTGRDADLFPYRDGKAQRMIELAEREGIDLAASYGYSDSESDLPMLRLVGHAVAVNPDSELEAIAAEEGWEVMRFDQLGRKLLALGALALMGLVGTAGRTVVVRRAAAPPAGPRLRTPWKR